MGINKAWQRNITMRLPKYFNTLGGKCTIILSDCVVGLSKAILSAQSPVLETYFMSAERDQTSLISRNRELYLEKEAKHLKTDSDEEEEEEEEGAKCEAARSVEEREDDSDVLILTEYYGYDDVVQDFFRSFYTGKIHLTPATYRITLKLACQYEVQWIIDEGCKFLDDFLKPHNFIVEFKFLILFKNPQITTKITELVQKMEFEELVKPRGISTAWFTLDHQHLLYLLPVLPAPSEYHIFSLAFQWLEFDPSRKIKFEKTLSTIGLINLSMRFLSDFLLKHAEGKYIESAALYKMIMAAQNHRFMKEMGMEKPMKADFLFPKIFTKRPTHRGVEEHEFTISRANLLDQVPVDILAVQLILDTEQVTKSKLRFSRPCPFVYVANGDLIGTESIRDLLIPVFPDGTSYVSAELQILDMIIRDRPAVAVAEVVEEEREEKRRDDDEDEPTTDKLHFVACLYTS